MHIEKSIQAIHPGGTHPIYYSEYPGDPAKTVMCVHGLSRNGHDFDWLAQALCVKGYRVICPDMAGRGRSPAFRDPSLYNYPQYMSDLQMLMAELNIQNTDWIGTSMGGLLGMMIAAMPDTPIRRFVINDVGPFIPGVALMRIKEYVGMNPYYRDWETFDAAFRKRFASFGLRTEAEWEHMARISAHKAEDGRYRMNYDPKIIYGLEATGHIGDLDLWPLWAMVKQPVLILHGADSDVLSRETVDRMMVGKRASAVTFAGVGHAPALMSPDQISVIKTWLADTAF